MQCFEEHECDSLCNECARCLAHCACIEGPEMDERDLLDFDEEDAYDFDHDDYESF